MSLELNANGMVDTLKKAIGPGKLKPEASTVAIGPKVIGHSNYCFTLWQVFLNTQRAPSSAIKKECSIAPVGTRGFKYFIK